MAYGCSACPRSGAQDTALSAARPGNAEVVFNSAHASLALAQTANLTVPLQTQVGGHYGGPCVRV